MHSSSKTDAAGAAICAFALAEFVIPFSVISFGERWISSSVTGILIAMVPLSIALIQRFFGVHERLGWWRIMGLGLGFVVRVDFLVVVIDNLCAIDNFHCDFFPIERLFRS